MRRETLPQDPTEGPSKLAGWRGSPKANRYLTRVAIPVDVAMVRTLKDASACDVDRAMMSEEWMLDRREGGSG